MRQRSRRITCTAPAQTSSSGKSAETALLRHIKAKIRFGGPITVAEYMKQVLTNPGVGYYMHRDVFGAHGDFTTSPEISQMFGEMIGVWCVNEWMRCGSPSKLNVVELGPGRGTLADDVLRVCAQFPGIRDAVSMHLVEVSPALSEMQRRKLSGQCAVDSAGQSVAAYGSGDQIDATPCRSRHGVEVRWYKQLSDVPHGFAFYVAHEFFDALPVHKFQKRDGRWYEVLVDIDESPDAEHHLRYVLAANATPASSLLLKVRQGDARDHIELCPDAELIVRDIAGRIDRDGGYALVADYGHFGDKTDTFRAFKEHKVFDALAEPGTADLTADVDFLNLKNAVEGLVCTHGPVAQEMFLHSMGIRQRLQVLLTRASAAQRKDLITGYKMLTSPEEMGERFKFFALLDRKAEEYVPPGFASLS